MTFITKHNTKLVLLLATYISTDEDLYLQCKTSQCALVFACSITVKPAVGIISTNTVKHSKVLLETKGYCEHHISPV